MCLFCVCYIVIMYMQKIMFCGGRYFMYPFICRLDIIFCRFRTFFREGRNA